MAGSDGALLGRRGNGENASDGGCQQGSVSELHPGERRTEGVVENLLPQLNILLYLLPIVSLCQVELVLEATAEGSSGSRPAIREGVIIVVCAMREMKLKTYCCQWTCSCYSRISGHLI